IGHDVTEIMPERFREQHRRGFERYAKTREGRAIGRTLLVQALRRDGAEVPVELSISTTVVAGREVIVGSLRGIEQRTLIDSFGTLHGRLTAAVTQLPGGLLMRESSGALALWNEAAKRLLGYEELPRDIHDHISEHFFRLD